MEGYYKFKMFCSDGRDQKHVDALEPEVNTWLADHPGITICNTLLSPATPNSNVTLVIFYKDP